MKNEPGYPLPDGELGDDEIVCQLVYLPDRPEYWRAFLGALSYMTTWRAWERDDDKRGKDAAANWRAAFELTMECWRMACLEQLQDDVAAILALMQIPQSCCDPGDFTDGDQYTDRVEDGEGDVPQPIIDAGYAEDAADWEGFADYKCMIAHVTVSQLVERLNEIAPLVDATGAVLGGVAALAGIIAVIVGTGGLAIVFGIVAGIGATALLYQAITDFDLIDGLAIKVADNHDELVCAIYQADGDVGSLVALNDKIDELFTGPEALVLKNMNLGPTLKALYAGRYDQQDIANTLLDAGYKLGDFSCECLGGIGQYQTFTEWYEDDYEGWVNQDGNGDISQDGMEGGWAWHKSMMDSAPNFFHSNQTLMAVESQAGGAGSKILLHQVKYWYIMTGSNGQNVRLVTIHDGGTEVNDEPYVGVWTEVIVTFDPPLESTYNLARIVKFIHTGVGYHLYIDRITVDWTFVPAP